MAAPYQITDVDGLLRGGATSEQPQVIDATNPIVGFGPNNVWLYTLGLMGWNTRTLTVDTILDASHGLVHADASGGVRTIYLPADASAVKGLAFVIRKIDTSANMLQISTQNSQVIDWTNGVTTVFYLPVAFSWVSIYSDGSTTWRVLEFFEGFNKPGSATVLAASGTITPAQNSVLRMAPAAAVASIVMSNANVTDNREVTIYNESAFTITFAAQATSHVADGVSSVIAANSAHKMKYSASTSLWYSLK